MQPRAVAACLLVSCLIQTAWASFEVELAGVKVVHPVTSKGRMNVAMANFGVPKYGASLVGEIVYPNPSAQYSSHAYQCKPAACNYGCNFFNESSPAFTIKKEPGRHYIMLLDRGPRDHTGLNRPCYFIDKAYHAQAAGADALLVVNDNPGDLSTAVAPKDEDSSRELAQITIPAGLLSQADGESLKELLRKGGVSVALNWTDLMPKASKVEWEFWTNSNDECGVLCDKQRKFIKDFKPVAKQLESAGLVSFQPHYLIWVCQFGAESDECKTQCIRNGAYCCPDPDDNIVEGYSGADVLMMNVRSLCVSRVARDVGEPWLWWEYVDKMGEECKMKDRKFDTDCSEKVFKEVVKGSKLAGDAGLKSWHDCLDIGKTDGTDKIPLLDEELKAQTGSDTESTIAIMPTVRVNGKQYRGTLDGPSVLRAVCSGFPTGSEPGVCNEEWVSDNECKIGGDGWNACNSGLNSTMGKTKCVNTFTGYSCECGEGFMKVVDKATGVDSCSEINECLVSSVPFTKEECKCERCACVNTVGSYNCTGPLANMCTPEHNYGGCWRDTIEGKFYHSCFDDIRTFRWMGQYGITNDSTPTYRCECPPCFRETPSGGCEPACDLSHCLGADGCGPDAVNGRRGGMSAGGVFMLLIASVAITAGGMYAVYQTYVKKKLQEDMRNILEEYVPLNSAPDSSSNGNSGGMKFTSSLVPDFTAVSQLAPRLSIGVSTPKVSDGAAGNQRFSQSSGQSNTPTGTPLSGSAGNNGGAGSSGSSSGSGGSGQELV